MKAWGKGDDVLSWTSDALFYKSLCSDRRKQQYSRLCWVMAACRRNLALLCHTKRWLHWFDYSKWGSDLRSGHKTPTPISQLWEIFRFSRHKLWQWGIMAMLFFVHSCIWLNCERGEGASSHFLPTPSQSVVMTKGCVGSKSRTKAPSSWLPTETGSNTA